MLCLKNILTVVNFFSEMFYFRVKVSEVLHGATNLVAPTKNYVEVISFHLINKKFPSFHVIYYLPTTKIMSNYLIQNISQPY